MLLAIQLAHLQALIHVRLAIHVSKLPDEQSRLYLTLSLIDQLKGMVWYTKYH